MIDALPVDDKTPIVHTMFEYAMDLVHIELCNNNREALIETIRWADRSIHLLRDMWAIRNDENEETLANESFERRIDLKSHRLNDRMMITPPRMVAQRHTVWKGDEKTSIIKLDASFGFLIQAESEKFIDYMHGSIEIDRNLMPESASRAIIEKAETWKQNGQRPNMMLHDVIDVRIGKTSLPNLPITRAREMPGRPHIRFELNSSWQEWDVMRDRIIARYEIRKDQLKLSTLTRKYPEKA